MILIDHLDFAGLEAQNMRLQSLAAAPGTPAAGLIYFDTASSKNTPRYYDGAAWKYVSKEGHTHTISEISDWPGAVSMTEVGYLDGVTSAIQSQLNNKQPLNTNLTLFAGLTSGSANNGGGLLKMYPGESQLYFVTLTAGTGIAITADINDNPIISIAAHTHTISQITDWPGAVSMTEVGYLDGVTSAIQSQLNAKAPLASPALTGTPTAPTAAGGTNTTQIATTAFVKSAIDTLIASAPGALDTLNELAAALGNDANFSTTITSALALKAPLASPALTGTPTAPTAAGGTNTTQIATTAFVQSQLSSTLGTYSYAEDIGGSNPITVTHNLGTKDITVQFFRKSDSKEVFPTVTRTSTSAISVAFGSTPSASSIRVVVKK